MTLATQALLELIAKRVEGHGTVVWYDPQRVYADLVASLSPEPVAGAAIHVYDPARGFVWLHRQLEPLWRERIAPPCLIIYVPLARDETHHALIEFETGGVVVQPGQQPSERNIALASVARRALQVALPPAAVDEIVQQVEAGKLSLAELDALAEKGLESRTGALAIVFGTGKVDEISLRFLAEPALDAQIAERQAADDLAGLLSGALGVPLSAAEGIGALRARLARQVLVTDLLEALGDRVPQALRTFPLAERSVARQAAAGLAQAWRNRRDLAQRYVHWAERVGADIGVGSLELELDALARTETFAATETRLQQEVERALARRASARLIALAEGRLEGFWAAQRPAIKGRWEVIVAAGQVLAEADRVDGGLTGKQWPPDALLAAYALQEQPWCRLDTAQRHLERDFHRFELDLQQHTSLIQLVAHARQRYAAAADRLAEAFTRAYAEHDFEMPGVLPQVDVYREHVAPARRRGKVAYLLVDGLRFEMAAELNGILAESWQSDLVPALAIPPTITEVGMAALVPGAEDGVTVAAAEGGNLAVTVGGEALRTRQERLAYAATTAGGAVAVARLDQLAPLADLHLRQQIGAADLVLVTATEEIDTLCETNPALARRVLDDAISQLRRAIKTLFGLGVREAVVTADHGYLFGERLSSGAKIDSPGGKTVALKRRVWVGRGGAKAPGFLRAPLSAFGVGGDLELATPWNLSCFKAPGGGTEYFHGGLSLPELVIPVVTVRPAGDVAPTTAARVAWELMLGSARISTRFVSVTVSGRSQELLPIEPPTFRVEVRAHDQAISVPVSASYGFREATKDVQLAVDDQDARTIAANTVTLMITEMPPADQVAIHLLDATTGVSLARIEHVPFAIVL